MSVDELTHIMEHEEPGRPRRGLVILLTLALIGALIAVLLLTQGDKDALAQLRIRDDSVSVKPTEAEVQQGVEGQALVAGDTIITDGNGEAQIDYFDGSETRMDASTTLVIGALLNEAGSRNVSITQSNGRLWHRVEQVTSAEGRYEVRTPNAVATVRGTTFATIGTYAPRWFYLGFEGETIVQVLKTGEEISLLEDECVTVSEKGNVRRCTPGELEKLLDEKLQEWKAYQGLQLDPQATTSPSASPSASPELRRATSGGGGSGGSAADTPTPRGRKPSINTPDPDEEEEESPSPSAEPSPSSTPPEETPIDCDNPDHQDEPECQVSSQ